MTGLAGPVVAVLTAVGGVGGLTTALGIVIGRRKTVAEANAIASNTVNDASREARAAAVEVMDMQRGLMRELDIRVNKCEQRARAAEERAGQAEKRASKSEARVQELTGISRRVILDMAAWRDRVRQLEELMADAGIMPPTWDPPTGNYALGGPRPGM